MMVADRIIPAIRAIRAEIKIDINSLVGECRTTSSPASDMSMLESTSSELRSESGCSIASAIEDVASSDALLGTLATKYVDFLIHLRIAILLGSNSSFALINRDNEVWAALDEDVLPTDYHQRTEDAYRQLQARRRTQETARESFEELPHADMEVYKIDLDLDANKNKQAPWTRNHTNGKLGKS
jgi:hypothetical protein